MADRSDYKSTPGMAKKHLSVCISCDQPIRKPNVNASYIDWNKINPPHLHSLSKSHLNVDQNSKFLDDSRDNLIIVNKDQSNANDRLV